MVNRLKGEAEFTVDGERFVLVFDAEALLAIEDALDIGLLELFERLDAARQDPRKMRLGTLSTILVCGLAKHHPDVDRALACDLLVRSMPEVESALDQALSRSLPSADDSQEAGTSIANPPKASGAGTGKRSSASGAKRGSGRKTSGKARRG